MPDNSDFLGRGWSFPPTFVKSKRYGGDVALVEGKQDIEQSLDILLRTSIGERVMQPEYGCNMADYLFDPNNSALIGFLKDTIYNAILYHEPRIRVEQLDVSTDGTDAIEGRLQISIDYTVRQTNSRYNFVWDFYQTEGVSDAL
ncbi:MAG: GPW/gp25 family protein [Bacteroidota bacterium]